MNSDVGEINKHLQSLMKQYEAAGWTVKIQSADLTDGKLTFNYMMSPKVERMNITGQVVFENRFQRYYSLLEAKMKVIYYNLKAYVRQVK